MPSSFGWLGTNFTVLTGIAGGLWVFYKHFDARSHEREQRRDELEQRREEYRWRQTKTAKELVDEMLDDKFTTNAFNMLDSWSREFETARGERQIITDEQWLDAIKSAAPRPGSPDVATDPIGIFVRDSFDGLFYHMALLDNYLDQGFVRFQDIEYPLAYYIGVMAEDKDIYAKYLSNFKLGRVEKFLDRFTEWTGSGRSALAAG